MKTGYRVKITIELSVPVEKNFDIEAWLMKQEKGILIEVLESIDKQISMKYVSQGYRVIRTHKRKLKTTFGTIEFTYRILRKGDKRIVPLLSFLDLSRGQRVSNFLKNLTAFVAIEYPYRKVEKMISDMREVDISHASIRKFLLESDYERKQRRKISSRGS